MAGSKRRAAQVARGKKPCATIVRSPAKTAMRWQISDNLVIWCARSPCARAHDQVGSALARERHLPSPRRRGEQASERASPLPNSIGTAKTPSESPDFSICRRRADTLIVIIIRSPGVIMLSSNKSPNNKSCVMTLSDFRRIALSMPETEELNGMGYPNFRTGRKSFATIEDAMVVIRLTRDQQAIFVATAPELDFGQF
jgi:hypothetical protein